APVMKDASFEAKNAIAAATSSGLPTSAARLFRLPISRRGLFHSIGVSIAPGSTALTRMPSFWPSIAADRAPSASYDDATSGVQIGPGATALVLHANGGIIVAS